MTPQQSPTDTSVLREQYLAAELDYVVANFPIISLRFRKRLRRIATFTLVATALNKIDPQQTAIEKLVNIMVLSALNEWPNVSVKQLDQFVLWYFTTVRQLSLSESDFQLLLEA